jgi:hypothetical protein
MAAYTLTHNTSLPVHALAVEVWMRARAQRELWAGTDLAEQEQRARALEADLPGNPDIAGDVLGGAAGLKYKLMRSGLRCQSCGGSSCMFASSDGVVCYNSQHRHRPRA